MSAKTTDLAWLREDRKSFTSIEEDAVHYLGILAHPACATGLKLECVHATHSPFSIVEAKKV